MAAGLSAMTRTPLLGMAKQERPLDEPFPRASSSLNRRSITLITTASLKSSTVKDLTELAKSHGLSGWHSMKKDQLIRGLLRITRKPVSKPASRAAKKARVAAASAKAKK